MILKLAAAAALAAICAVPALAGVPLRYISAGEAARIVLLPKADLAGNDTFRFYIGLRNKPGKVEIHAAMDDELIIQDGAVRVNYGGTPVNARAVRPGERLGDSITGGKSVLMHAGDIITIPAGTPHQMLTQTPTMRYIVIKTKASPGVKMTYTSAAKAARLQGGAHPPTLAGNDDFSLSLRARTQSSHVEKHDGWHEIVMMQEGDVTLHYDGGAANAKQTAPGEWRGTAITAGKTAHLGPGDIVIVPAGTWHQQVLNSPRMRYILFKTKN